MAEIGTDIEKAIALLEQGELVAIPTETVYGLAGNALQSSSILKIFETKNRPQFDPLIVHVTSISNAEKYVEDIPDKGLTLAKTFWPGPLTLLLKKKTSIPDLVTSGLDTVGIRCPNHPLTQNLLKKLSIFHPMHAQSLTSLFHSSRTISISLLVGSRSL
jgi:L-threonylcarbamoyladenylate synthase